MESVEAQAEREPHYKVIPRNGWVWERLSDGSVSVFKTEDFMLQRTIESVDDCPTAYVFPAGIPVAYRIENN